jgi:raffinose/stachyose/melibiose transport system permease protein
MLKDVRTYMLLAGPALLVFILFVPFPALFSVVLSFFKWDLVGAMSFLGLGNYRFMLFDDPVFWKATRNTGIFVILSTLLQLPLAFLLANLLARMTRSGYGIFRGIIFLPVTFSGVAVSLMFYFIYHPNVGLLNGVLKLAGIGSNFPWLGDARTALVAVIVSLAWQWTGYHMVIYLTGLTTIPDELWEAARIDGANELQVTRHIVLPLLLPAIRVSAILIITSSLKSFDQIYIMTFGGPNHASEVLASQMYLKTFAQLKYGYGSALSTVLLLLCVLSALGLDALFSRLDDKETV